MRTAIGLAVAILFQVALHAAHVWWVLAACQPLLLVVVYQARHHLPIHTAWMGLAAGLATDVLSERIIGPGGIAGAIAGALVATTLRRFEMEGPLFWIVGSLVAASASELAWVGLLLTLGAQPEHGLLGVLATVATTAAGGFVVAAGERVARWWRSPERRRRQALRRL
jgi:rod shape-determining protein MreD